MVSQDQSSSAQPDDGLRTSDPEWIRALIENKRTFLAFLRRRLPEGADAEDLLSHSVMKALQASETGTLPEDPVAWFYRVLRNALTDHYRADAAHQRRGDGWARDLADRDEALAAPPDEALRKAVCACLEGVLPALHPEYARLIRAVDLEGRPVAEASPGDSPNAAGVRLHRARKALRRALELSCGSCTEHACLECTCGEGPAHRA